MRLSRLSSELGREEGGGGEREVSPASSPLSLERESRKVFLRWKQKRKEEEEVENLLFFDKVERENCYTILPNRRSELASLLYDVMSLGVSHMSNVLCVSVFRFSVPCFL